MQTLKEFFKNNEVQIGEGKDFTTIPPVYYTSLHEAFYNYFLTFRDHKDTYHFISNVQDWTKKAFAFNSGGSKDHIVISILGFHRFIELLLKDILRRINPLLAVKYLDKEENIFEYLDNNVVADDVNADEIKTIEYAEAFKRFKQALKYYPKDSETYTEYLKEYDFIGGQTSIETLRFLTEWRNRIMHNGKAFPNLFAFEYLVSQRIIPLIDKVIKAEKKYLVEYLPHYFKTATGIKVIDEIVAVKFKFTDLEDKNKANKLLISLVKLGHLKEIGRAAYNSNTYIRNNTELNEPYYDNPIGRAERFARVECDHPEFYNLTNCICCGVNSLVVYRKSVNAFWVEKKYISWFRCYNCDYSLKDNVGDPSLFKLANNQIFATE